MFGQKQFSLVEGRGITNLLGVPLAMLTRFFNKEICIDHKTKSMEQCFHEEEESQFITSSKGRKNHAAAKNKTLNLNTQK